MIFNSLQYLIFLPVVVLLYYLLNSQYRWILLLVASYYFYMVWKPVYIILIIISTLVDYYCGIRMGRLETKKERRPFMFFSLFTGMTILGTFKYYDFFASSINDITRQMGMSYMIPILHLILPLGVSFYTFQTLSYTLDVYKGRTKAEKHLGLFAVYVMFFPQLIAGPIERAGHMIPQYHFKYKFTFENLTRGCRLILLGLFKKVVIADQLGAMVGNVFNNPQHAHGISIYLGCLLFAQQVYCDFSGYSDIARGSARLLGIDLMENFKLPFYSDSINNMWARWHISLMNWFRDYIMFPLIRDKWKWPIVFFLVFLISGIWHGANWTFVVWGVYNGIFIIYSKATEKKRHILYNRLGMKKEHPLRQFLQYTSVFHVFAMGSIFFRSATVSDSFLMINHMFTSFGSTLGQAIANPGNIRQELIYLGKDAVSFYMIIGFLVLLELFQWRLRNKSIDEWFDGLHTVPRIATYLFGVVSIILMSDVAENPFIYFQF